MSGFGAVEAEPFDAVEAWGALFREVGWGGGGGHFAEADEGGLGGELGAWEARDFFGEIAHGWAGGGDADEFLVP